MTPDRILGVLVEINLAAGAAIVLVLLARVAVRRRLGARAAYRLWLLAPVAVLGSLVPARLVTATAAGPAGAGVAQASGWSAAVPASAAGPGPASLLVALWLVGGAVCAALAIYRSRRLAADPALGPALVGVFRPRLVLPADFETRFDADERRLILAHEAVHAAAGDPTVNGLLEAARCLSWFNPLVHLAAFYVRVDQELACDAAVVERHPGERRIYAQALLKSQLSTAFLPLGCQWPGRSKPLLTERIEMLASALIRPARRRAGAAVVLAAALATGLGAWAAQPPRTQAPASAGGVGAAIAAGDGLAVRALGGTPQQVVAALKVETRTHQPGGAAYAAHTLTELDRFADTSGGATLAFVPYTGPDLRTSSGRSVGGAHWGIERRTPDGMVQYILLMRDGKLFLGAPRRAQATT